MTHAGSFLELYIYTNSHAGSFLVLRDEFDLCGLTLFSTGNAQKEASGKLFCHAGGPDPIILFNGAVSCCVRGTKSELIVWASIHENHEIFTPPLRKIPPAIRSPNFAKFSPKSVNSGSNFKITFHLLYGL